MACECTYDYDAREDSVDAWDLEKYYSCNESPNVITDCELLNIGDSVEFSENGERIWGTITEICSDCSLCCDIVIGITTDLVLEHPFSTGDLVLISMSNIYNHVIAPENIPDPCDPCSSECCSPYVVPKY